MVSTTTITDGVYVPSMLTIIIDADILAFQSSKGAEKVVRWPNGIWSHWCDEEDTKYRFMDKVQKIKNTLKADKVILAFSSSNNFRKEVLSTYKGNRADSQKPLTHKWIIDYCTENQDKYDFETLVRDKLEGDDLLGILGTWDGLEGRKILVSEDKDIKTIPCTLYNPAKDTLVTYSEEEADYNHMYQTLCGDTTDGYKGCPSIGPKSADKFLAEEHEDLWKAVVSLYEKKGLTELEALQQARVARILRASDYNFDTREVILWKP